MSALVTGLVNRRLPFVVAESGVVVPVIVTDILGVCQHGGPVYSCVIADADETMGVDIVAVHADQLEFALEASPVEPDSLT